MELKEIYSLERVNTSLTNDTIDFSLNIWKSPDVYLQLWASGTSFFINLITFYVTCKNLKLQNINYYLINTTFCNILLLISNLIDKYKIDKNDQVWIECKTFPYIQNGVLNVILLTLLTLTLYWYIKTNQSEFNKCFYKGKLLKIMTIWLLGFVFALPFSYFNILQEIPETKKYKCNQEMPKYVLGVLALIFFILPMIAVLILYLRIMKNIREINSSFTISNRDESFPDSKQLESIKKAVTFIFLTVLTLFVSKFPERLYYILISWKITTASDTNWASFYIAAFYLYTFISAVFLVLTSIKMKKAIIPLHLEFKEKNLDSRPPQENQSLTVIEDNSNL